MSRVSSALFLVVAVACDALGQIALGPPHAFRPSGTGGAVVVGDFNGDGKPDLAVLETAAAAGIAGSVYLGKGDGTFQVGMPFGSATGNLLAAGDFNGDGHADLAIASKGMPTVTVLLGKGDGSFQLAGSFVGSPSIANLIAADFNGDGKTDLAILDGLGSLSIFQGHGDGSLQMASQYSIPHVSLNSLAAADFNGDGKLDIGVLSGNLLGPASEGFLTILLGRGDLTFSALASQPTAAGATSLAVGDFNLDGKPDVEITGFGNFPYYNRVIRVLLGAGSGTFSPSFSTPDPYLSAGNSYGTVSVADFSGDGKPDLMAVINGGIGFMAGDGRGGFQNSIVLVASAGPGLLTADFNGDGKPDVATSDSVYLNTTSSAAGVGMQGVVNAASFRSEALVPGSLISIYGHGLSLPLPDILFSLPPVFTLRGTQITVNGFPASLLYTSPSQVNAQVPWEVGGVGQGTFGIAVEGVPGQPVTAPLSPYGPGIFMLDAAGQGAVLIATPGTVIAAPDGALFGSRPVNRGEYLEIFATGLGPVSNQPQTGTVSPYIPLAETMVPPTVEIGGVSATVSFSGLTPGLLGVYQINALVPPNAFTGDSVPLKVSISGVSSNTVFIAVR